MRPAARQAPLDYLFAIAVAAITVVFSFFVKPATTEWVVFSVGVVMAVSVLAAALRPVKVERRR